MSMPAPELHGDHTPEGAAAVRKLYYAYVNGDWRAGSAEPWIADIVCALMRGNNTRTCVEIGGFEGFTSKRLARVLCRMPHPTRLAVCEIDADRAAKVHRAILNEANIALSTNVGLGFDFRVFCDDSLKWIPTLADASVDFAWVDGNHEKVHVAQELTLLYPKLAPGGIICGHDVWGVCDLRTVFAAFPNAVSLDLPRMGPAGGLGIVQRPRE